MKPTTFSPCSATMPMQLRWRRQRRKSSSVHAYSKDSCSVCNTSGMSRRIIHRMWTRTCSFSVRFVLIAYLSSPRLTTRRAASPGGCSTCPRNLGFVPLGDPRNGRIGEMLDEGCQLCAASVTCLVASLRDLINAPSLAQGQDSVPLVSRRQQEAHAPRSPVLGARLSLVVQLRRGKKGESLPLGAPSWRFASDLEEQVIWVGKGRLLT